MTALLIATLLVISAEPTLGSGQARFTGTLSCASASCHARVEPLHQSGATQRQEYLHFRGGDPHARAGQRLSEPRYLNVLAQLAPDRPAQDVHLARCANCHDPLGKASEAAHVPLGRGIGCESCHGPAGDWIAVHFERGIARQRLTQLGMADTKDALTRARACAACHVGSAANDVNHDMYAAGHPPLLFEMGSHQALIERKHWDDRPRRDSDPNYEVELWAAGRIASAEAALSLLAGRAEQAAHGQAPWPEFAESNCTSCHQPLLAAGASRGIAPWQSWNVMFAGELLPRAKLPLEALRAEMDSSFVPDAAQVASLASAARDILSEHFFPPENAATALASISTPSEAMTFDRACHELAALVAAERALTDAGSATGIDRQRIGSIAAALRRLDTSSQSPAQKKATLAEVAAEMSRLRQDLAAAANKP